jgi:hypothetical protein
MKVLFTSLLLSLWSIPLGAQTNSEIVTWQHSHPEVIFIESSDLDRILESGIELQGKFIVYSDQVSIEDIANYELEEKTRQSDSESNIYSERDENANIIKLWLAQNGDLKILQRNYFDQLNETQKAMYLENGALILTTELLTLKDINDYESAH